MFQVVCAEARFALTDRAERLICEFMLDIYVTDLVTPSYKRKWRHVPRSTALSSYSCKPVVPIAYVCLTYSLLYTPSSLHYDTISIEAIRSKPEELSEVWPHDSSHCTQRLKKAIRIRQTENEEHSKQLSFAHLVENVENAQERDEDVCKKLAETNKTLEQTIE